MKHLAIPKDLRGKELFKFLKENKSIIIAQKKYEVKQGDAVSLSNCYVNNKGQVTKGNNPVADDVNTLNTTLVINTTNVMDSHSDVHIPGLWKKSLQESTGLYLLQEHSMTFKGIISDEINAYTKNLTWKALGLDMPGETQALIFAATIKRSRNDFMFNEYKQGHVKNHSVGMRYVKIDMAINDDSKWYVEEKEVWDKYIDQVVNKSDAEEQEYFFVVTEAKVVEGSAVPIGSNIYTPTLENNKSADTTEQPPTGTDGKPSQDSEDKSMVICPNPTCNKHFNAKDSTNCPGCGQYVSLNSTQVELDTFDLMKAIKELKFTI